MGFERVEALSIRKPALHATRPAGCRLLPSARIPEKCWRCIPLSFLVVSVVLAVAVPFTVLDSAIPLPALRSIVEVQGGGRGWLASAKTGVANWRPR